METGACDCLSERVSPGRGGTPLGRQRPWVQRSYGWVGARVMSGVPLAGLGSGVDAQSALNIIYIMRNRGSAESERSSPLHGNG